MAELTCVALMAGHGDFSRPGQGWLFAALGVAAGGCFLLAASGFTGALASLRHRGGWFWAVAILLRLAILPVVPGDDIWRYRWEGKIQAYGHNPYVLAPDASALEPLRDGEWTGINHRHFPAIYPPLAEAGFAALAAVGLPVL
ncbi:MAG: glycosyltransferase family 2 protein, partial [Gluconacetobacter diazotrophicus]|nr:glycosyltransferase family 2 protein [Gluconacetobacter diazotrophicus]